MKRLLIIIAMLAALLFAVTVHAADETIYVNDEGVSASDTAQELSGWGYEISDTCFYEADVKFGGEGAGFTLVNKDGTKGGTSIRAMYKGDALTLCADGGTGSYFIYYIPVDTEKWYHIKLIGSYGVENALVDMVVDTYDAEMKIEDTKNYYVILMNQMYASSGNAPEHIRVEANTEVKNMKVTRLVPDEIRINTPSDVLPAGTSVDLTVKAYREGAELNCELDTEYTVSGAAVMENGRLTVNPDAEPGSSVSVKAKCGEIENSAEFTVVSDKALEICGAYIDEATNKVSAVDAKKNFYTAGSCVIVVNVYTNEGVLADSFVKPFNGGAVETGTVTKLPIDYALPEGMSINDCAVEISPWVTGSGDAPTLSGVTAVRSFFEENNGSVEWNGEYRSITAAAGDSVYVMQIGNKDMYINGEKVLSETAPYIENDKAYVEIK